MLRSMKEIIGYRIEAIDGELGKVADMYFEDTSWETRYLVAQTRRWLPGRKVLIAPVEVGEPDWEQQHLPVSLTREQVEQSPPIDEAQPVSRQQEEALSAYFAWAPYWAPVGNGVSTVPLPMPSSSEPPDDADPHLRSFREVCGYHVQAVDGDIGHVEDMIVSTENWMIGYLVIDTGHWLSGRKILLAPSWFEEVMWSEQTVRTTLTQEQVEGSPPYDEFAPINRDYEATLYDYYGRPRQWTERPGGEDDVPLQDWCVRHVMTHGVVAVGPDASLHEVAGRLTACDVGMVAVLDGGRLVGVVSDRDIVTDGVSEGRQLATVTAADVMSSPVICCGAEDRLEDAAALMSNHAIRRLLVANSNGRPKGVCSLGDIAHRGPSAALAGRVLGDIAHRS